MPQLGGGGDEDEDEQPSPHHHDAAMSTTIRATLDDDSCARTATGATRPDSGTEHVVVNQSGHPVVHQQLLDGAVLVSPGPSVNLAPGKPVYTELPWVQ